MQVIVHAEDNSGRGDGYYTKPDLATALDAFFRPDGDPLYADSDGEEILTREDVVGAFDQNHTVTFYNEDGERFVITRDVLT